MSLSHGDGSQACCHGGIVADPRANRNTCTADLDEVRADWALSPIVDLDGSLRRLLRSSVRPRPYGRSPGRPTGAESWAGLVTRWAQLR